jgi:hypothetical protein
MKEEKRTFPVFNTRNSLFRNTLPVTPLNPKTWRDFFPNSMIPEDRRGGGVPHTKWLVT